MQYNNRIVAGYKHIVFEKTKTKINTKTTHHNKQLYIVCEEAAYFFNMLCITPESLSPIIFTISDHSTVITCSIALTPSIK